MSNAGLKKCGVAEEIDIKPAGELARAKTMSSSV